MKILSKCRKIKIHYFQARIEAWKRHDLQIPRCNCRQKTGNIYYSHNTFSHQKQCLISSDHVIINSIVSYKAKTSILWIHHLEENPVTLFFSCFFPPNPKNSDHNLKIVELPHQSDEPLIWQWNLGSQTMAIAEEMTFCRETRSIGLVSPEAAQLNDLRCHEIKTVQWLMIKHLYFHLNFWYIGF